MQQQQQQMAFIPPSFPSTHCKPSELRALAFFREQTAPILSNFSTFTQRFWYEVIPQLSDAEPAVKHMTIALATRQELVGCAPARLYALSLVRADAFAAALALLTRPGCSLVATLMCCLLFLGYECLQDPMEINPATSVRHLGAGLRILEERAAAELEPETTRESESQSVSDLISTYLEPMYLGMEMMLSMFTTPIAIYRDLSSSTTAGGEGPLEAPPKHPARFTDPVAARRAFYAIYRWQFHFRAANVNVNVGATGGGGWTPTSPAFRTVRSLFTAWHALVLQYNDALPATAVSERKAVMSMLSHWSLLMVALVHSTASSSSSSSSAAAGAGAGAGGGSPFFPRGGRMKTSLVDLTDPHAVTVTFIVDARTLPMLEICDWSGSGPRFGGAAVHPDDFDDEGGGDENLNVKIRIWPVLSVRKLRDGRGIVKLSMFA